MGDTSCRAKSNPKKAAELIESMHKERAVKEWWLVYHRSLAKRTQKNTGESLEQWEYLGLREREKERERRGREARERNGSIR